MPAPSCPRHHARVIVSESSRPSDRIRVIASERSYPSHRVRAIVSESSRPSDRIRVIASESSFPSGRNSTRKPRTRPAGATSSPPPTGAVRNAPATLRRPCCAVRVLGRGPVCGRLPRGDGSLRGFPSMTLLTESAGPRRGRGGGGATWRGLPGLCAADEAQRACVPALRTDGVPAPSVSGAVRGRFVERLRC